MQAEVEITHVQEIGLRLPDGTLIFPPDTWHGRGVATAEDRKIILEAIHVSAANLSLVPEALVEQFSWVVRTSQELLTKIPVGDELHSLGEVEFITAPTENGESAEPIEAEVYDGVAGDGDGWG